MSKSLTTFKIAKKWYEHKGWTPHSFQKECWEAICKGKSGLLNAPTGFGKTYAIWMGVLERYHLAKIKSKGLHALWITPLRALSKEIYLATNTVSETLNLDYTIGLRSGDTSITERNRQKKNMPNGLITTPESLHLLFAQKDNSTLFKNLDIVVVDEWHELMGSKRGVQIELALSRLKSLNPNLLIWGISATIGNMDEAIEVLHGEKTKDLTIVKCTDIKETEIVTLIPNEIDKYPWGGHLGIQMLQPVIDIIQNSTSTLIFTNTRSQCEIWYQRLLEASPELAGIIALHHGSLSEEVRQWVENALHDGILKVVVCTSSLDLGVDFRPVDTVIQIGSPKGVARFMQRAGRSGHRPGAKSKIYFLPTHSLEIVEGAALRHASTNMQLEHRIPFIRSFDVLIQYLITLAVGEGFDPDAIFKEIIKTHCFSSIDRDEFNWCLSFITHGGSMLDAYDEYHKVIVEDGLYKVKNRKIAMQHRLNMGTIVSDSMISVKFQGGGSLGAIEEWFISKLKPGDAFWFAGRNLELISIKEMTAYVKKATKKNGVIPAWQGGRMPLSSELSVSIRQQINQYITGKKYDVELEDMQPLLDEQSRVSVIPQPDQLLIEKLHTKDGYHIFIYPFEGRNVHEGMAALFAWKISQIIPITFSIAMNDYGFELLSDQLIPIEEALGNALFDSSNLSQDLYNSLNIAEMARRKFRDIASISGLVLNNYPGKQIKTRHVQANSQLFFNIFQDQDTNNLLLQQAYDEVMTFQMEQARMRDALVRMESMEVKIIELKSYSPFCFPILTERIRERFSNEKMEDRIKKMLKGIS